MGSWNQTCGLTNLHIVAGEPVVVFVLQEVEFEPNYCYTTPFFKPILMPFYSKYNDYGAGFDSSGIGLPQVLGGIKDHLVELPQGDNTVHDIPVTKEAFNEELFWKANLEDRLFVAVWPKAMTRVGVVMIHKKIFDYILEHHKQDWVFYDADGVFQQTQYGFADIANGVPAVADQILEFGLSGQRLAMLSQSFERLLWRPTPQAVTGRLAGISPELNLAAKWLFTADEGRFSRIVQPIEVVNNFIESNNRDGLIEIMTEILKALYIDHFMLETRKIWTPQGGSGSQNCDPTPYRTLMAGMEKVLVEAEDEFD